MKPEIKKLWVDALRSGKYKRGTGQLRDGDRYCCLGVLCDIRGVKFDGDAGGLDIQTQIWAGVETYSPIVNVRGQGERELAELNDSGWTFKRLANLIERQL